MMFVKTLEYIGAAFAITLAITLFWWGMDQALKVKRRPVYYDFFFGCWGGAAVALMLAYQVFK